MTDLITRARKAWLDERIGRTIPHGNPCPIPPERCPPEVVAALLGALAWFRLCYYDNDDFRMCCRTMRNRPHTDDCPVARAEAAIDRALEGK